MSFRCCRPFRLFWTECRPPGAKKMDVDFKWYDVDVRVVVLPLLVLLCPFGLIFGVWFTFLQWSSGRVTGFFTSMYKACIPRQYGVI